MSTKIYSPAPVTQAQVGCLSESLSTVLHDLLLKLQEERGADNRLARKLEQPQLQLQSPSCIKLNVGGTIFVTTISTLTSTASEGSYFDAMFSGRWDTKSYSDDEIFIDRDPTVFRHVLNFLRGVEPDLELFSKADLRELLIEADFYGLSDLVNRVENMHSVVFTEGPRYTLKNRGKKAICNIHKKMACTVLGPELKPDIPITIRIDSSSSSAIMVGLAPPTINQNKEDNYKYDGSGWYFFCANQTLCAGVADVLSRRYAGLDGKLEPGQTLGVKLSSKGEVSYIIDGKDCGVAYIVPTGISYRLAVLMCHENDAVELVS